VEASRLALDVPGRGEEGLDLSLGKAGNDLQSSKGGGSVGSSPSFSLQHREWKTFVDFKTPMSLPTHILLSVL
jgi:hypothetical protein